MKNIITTILITLLTYSLYAQVPGIGQVPLGMKYQAVARGADGQAMNSEDITLQFTILRDNTPVFTEVQATSTNNLGLFVLTIGSVNNTDYSNIDWRLGDHFLKVEVNDGGWQDLGTHQLLSVPYAVTAGNGKQKHPELQDESLWFHGTNGSENVVIGGTGADGILNDGLIQIKDENSNIKVTLLSNPNQDAGSFALRGRNNNNNIVMGAASITDADFGVQRICDENGDTRILQYSAPARNGSGIIDIKGSNNSNNVTIGSTSNDDHGRVYVHDSGGTIKALMGVRDNGRGLVITNDLEADGFIAAHIKNFRMNHPKDAEKEIWYACIEGPEAAAYERGTAQLVDGEVRVDFSEHFELVVNPSTLTVTLTPLDAASKGLAVVEKTARGFVVKELGGGTGNYQFDWRVEGVRKGYEDFEVIRDKAEMERMLGIDTEEK